MRAIDVYNGSDGEQTKAYYARLSALGVIGVVAMNLFRAQKCSARAKVYRGGIRGQGSYRGMAYERKAYSLDQLCRALAASAEQIGIRFGWKIDPKTPLHGSDSWVLYVDLPHGQVSFHSPTRYAGPDYLGDWDQMKVSADRILAFCDAAIDGTVFSIPNTSIRGAAPLKQSGLFDEVPA